MKIYELEDHRKIYKDETIKKILSTAMFNPTEGRIKTAAEGIYNKQQGKFYVAEDDENIVGIIGVRRVDNAYVEIMHIAVDAAQQKKGIGKQLVKYIDECERVDEIIAQTDNDSVGFYKKLGFKIVETEDLVTGTVRYNCRYKCN